MTMMSPIQNDESLCLAFSTYVETNIQGYFSTETTYAYTQHLVQTEKLVKT